MTTVERGTFSLRTESLGVLHWVGILAATVTAVIHLRLGARLVPSQLGISFLLAGLGFLGAIGLILIGWRRRLVYAAGIPFTLAQVGIWYVLTFANTPARFPADVGTIGAVDEVAQLPLVAVLVALLQ
jgi:hypothetical protein